MQAGLIKLQGKNNPNTTIFANCIYKNVAFAIKATGIY